jgi:hypothetical protein
MNVRWAFSWLGPRLALVALGTTALLSYRAGGDLLLAVIRGIVAAVVVLWLQRIFLAWLQGGFGERRRAPEEPPDDQTASHTEARG